MELSKMFGVERGKWFKVLGFDCSLFRIIYDECKKEELQIKYPEKILFEPVNINMMYAVISVAPSGIIHLPLPLTNEQREQLKALYTLGYRWLAKDENGATYAYDKQKLAKGLTVWLSQKRGCTRIHDGMAEDVIIPLVSWSDPEPFDIGKALGVGE